MSLGNNIYNSLQLPATIKKIAEKVFDSEQISTTDAPELYNCSNLPLLGVLASATKKRLSVENVFFNQNFHPEPTNICINHCKFCSYRQHEGQKGAWE